MTVDEQLLGTVTRRNARGIEIDETSWCTVSKFAPIDLPPIGARVRVGVDKKGFIVALEVLELSTKQTSSRDQQIARLTVLKAAAHFAASRTDIKSTDVLRIADAWLSWLEAD